MPLGIGQLGSICEVIGHVRGRLHEDWRSRVDIKRGKFSF